MEQEIAPQNDGYELLKNVIKSIEENREQSIQLKLSNEDLLNLIGVSVTTIKATGELIESSIKNIPKSVELSLPEETKLSIDKNTEQHKYKRFAEYFSLIISGVALLIFVLVGKFALQWYSESIRTKSELRQEILDEIKIDGKAIYKIENYKQLEYNTMLMNKWIEKNPNDAEKFLRFKQGYESK